MATSLDGSAHGSTTASTTATATLTTANSNDIIVAFVEVSHPTNTPSVTSVAGGGLTWTKRQTKSVTFTANTAGKLVAEEWWAPAASPLAAQVITLTGAASGTPDHCNIIVFGVSGANSLVTPFDSDGSLPVSFSSADTGGNKNPNVGGSDRPTLNTTQAHSMVIGYNVSISSPTERADTPNSWVSIATENNAGGTDWSNAVAEEKIFSVAQTTLPVSWQDAENNYIILGDAITSDSTSTPVTGTATTLLFKIAQSMAGFSGTVATGAMLLKGIVQVLFGNVPKPPGTGGVSSGWSSGP